MLFLKQRVTDSFIDTLCIYMNTKMVLVCLALHAMKVRRETSLELKNVYAYCPASLILSLRIYLVVVTGRNS